MATQKSTRAVTQVPVRFPYQSYFDNVLLQGAILNQAQGSPIVASTRQVAQTPGVGVALHSSSESPIAIRFKGGQADSAEVILTPGQRLHVGSFESFEWGLPFGWLGGGTSVLYILHNDQSYVDFQASPPSPIPYHRVQIQVIATGAWPPAGAPVPNWPNAFPWDSAIRGVDANPQGGAAIINVSPSYALFRLRGSLVAPTVLSLLWRQADDLDTGADGLTLDPLAGNTELELPFPSVPVGSAAFPIAILQSEFAHIAGPFTNLTIVDFNAGSPLNGIFVDIVRYGTLS